MFYFSTFYSTREISVTSLKVCVRLHFVPPITCFTSLSRSFFETWGLTAAPVRLRGNRAGRRGHNPTLRWTFPGKTAMSCAPLRTSSGLGLPRKCQTGEPCWGVHGSSSRLEDTRATSCKLPVKLGSDPEPFW